MPTPPDDDATRDERNEWFPEKTPPTPETAEYLRLVIGPLPKRAERWSTAYLLVTVLMPVLLIVFLLGSLALTGGQFRPHSHPMWGEVLAYPIFPVPLFVCLVITGASVVLAVAQFVIHAELPARVWMGYFRVNLAAVVTTAAIALFVPDHSASGPPLAGTRGLAAIGDQWIAAIPFLVLAVVVAVISLVKDRRERALAPPPPEVGDLPPELRRSTLLSSTPPPRRGRGFFRR